MSFIVVFLHRLANLLRFLLRRRTPHSLLDKLLRFWTNLKRLLTRTRISRTPTSDTIGITDEGSNLKHNLNLIDKNIIPQSGSVVVCTSQVPPSITLNPGSPTIIAEVPRHIESLAQSRPSSAQFLHPYANLDHERLERPYSHSEPAMSLHRVSSRASSRSRDSTRTRVGSRPPSPIHAPRRSHVDTGIATPNVSIGRLSPSSERISVEPPSETTEIGSSRKMYPVAEISRYDKLVKMCASYPVPVVRVALIRVNLRL